MKSGRTHLMDATPVTLGQELGGYAAQCRYGGERLAVRAPAGRRAAARRDRGRHRPQRARPGSPAAVIADLAARTGLPLTEARDHFEAQGARDSLVELSGVLRTIAVGLYKVANDLRWLSQRTDDRARRDPPARPAAGVEHHAGQGQPGRPRGGLPGRRAGHRQRRRDRLRRRGRQPRAQRHAAGDRPQPARVDPAARPASAGCSPTAASTASPPTSSGCAATPRARRASSRRSTATSATRRRRWSRSRRSRRARRSARSSTSAATSRGECSPQEQLDEALDVLRMTRTPLTVRRLHTPAVRPSGCRPERARTTSPDAHLAPRGQADATEGLEA